MPLTRSILACARSTGTGPFIRLISPIPSRSLLLSLHHPFPLRSTRSIPNPILRQLSSSIPRRFSNPSSSHSFPPPPPPPISSPIVAKWLYFTSFLTLSIVVVGGLTRLTESGLSITEWKPFKGSLPPLTEDDWLEEYRKYQQSEEGMMYVSLSLSLSPQ